MFFINILIESIAHFQFEQKKRAVVVFNKKKKREWNNQANNQEICIKGIWK